MPEKQPYSTWINEDFKLACRDYFYLVDHHFPERGVLKLVGDRYRLDGDQRTVLYRGISSRKRSDMRHNLLVSGYHREDVDHRWIQCIIHPAELPAG